MTLARTACPTRSSLMRRNPENLESAGQDSFVDVVTNLVGIMIVLVIIVGVRTKHVWIDPGDSQSVACC